MHKGYLTALQQDTMVGIENYLQEIDSLITQEDVQSSGKKLENLPLLITGDATSGKSSLIAHWVQSYRNSHKADNDYFIIRFARVSPNDTSYISLLYSIYNQIREHYQLLLKLDVIEDKLRIDFKNWLQSACDKQQSSQIFRKYIIVIVDGIDKLRENSGKEELPEWLTSDIPQSIRVIISCNKNSRCYNYLINKVTSHVSISPFDIEKRLELFERCVKKVAEHDFAKYQIEKLRNFVISSDRCENPLYLKLLLHFCLFKNSKFPHLSFNVAQNTINAEDLFGQIIEYYSSNGFHKNIIIKVLGYLSITRCGLTIEELSRTCSHSESVLHVFEVFGICLYTYENLWMFKNDLYSKVILSKYFVSPIPLHLDIIESLNSYKLSVRSVHEKLFHYKESKEWMALKDTVCMLEVFFIMFTPQYRLELFMTWTYLREHHFDPVQEYNKSLEQFVEQHSPKNQEIFIILVQFCRFFKEFSEIEIVDTCEFRHPPLKRLHELKELNIFNEIKSLEGIINQKQINPLRKDESFAVENKKSRNLLKDFIINQKEIEEEERKKEKALNPNATSTSEKKLEMYYYKRWLWIQFPWCSLDVYSDFSEIMKAFSSEKMNFQHDNEMVISTLKIIREAKLKASKKYVPPKKALQTHPSSVESHERSVTAFVKASGILYESLPPLNTTLQNPVSEKTLPRQLSRGSSENFGKKIKTDYNFDLMFKELTPSNVLLKVGAKVADYSHHEILRKKKENNELQTNYNRLVNEARMKTLQLESIKSQIAKSEDKMKESREIAAKIEETKKKMEKIYEKINKAEVESKRLETVITCCFKNSAKNELWEKGLEKGIQNITELMEIENLELNQCQLEKEILDEQSSEFEHWFQDKIKIQENTLDRVAEQFSFKANIKEALKNGENKRANLISMQTPPRSENYNLNKLKEHQSIFKKMKKFKISLKEKIKNYEIIMKKLENVVSVSEPQDITSLIWKWERKDELPESRKKLDEKLKDLNNQKDALEVKLNFLKKKDTKTFQYDHNPEIAIQKIVELEKKVINYADVCKKQELTYYACEGIIQHTLNLLGLTHVKLANNNHREVLRVIGDKVISLKNLSKVNFFQSKTLKVETLQAPYSSKFNIEENHSPMGASALINSPLSRSSKGNSPIPNNSSHLIPRKSILRLPRY